jgi:hypothetical protein
MESLTMSRKWISLVLAVAVLGALVVPAAASGSTARIRAMMRGVNDALADMGEPMQLASVEYITTDDRQGQTVFFNNRAKQLGHHWVPNDPRNGNGTVLPWATDSVDLTGDVGAGAQFGAITSAMQTWQNETCSTIPLADLGLIPFDYGYV